MVTEAGKELLKNTINTAKFHNRIMEEGVMWKQWELEKGLTMMVSDDVIKDRKRSHYCSKHNRHHHHHHHYRHHHHCSKHKNHACHTKKYIRKESKIDKPLPRPSREAKDRWDHNGFKELYPDAGRKNSGKPASPEKWDHSGFEELYPEEEPDAKKELSEFLYMRKKRKKKPKIVDSWFSPEPEPRKSALERWEELKKKHGLTSANMQKPVLKEWCIKPLKCSTTGKDSSKNSKKNAHDTPKVYKKNMYDNHINMWRKHVARSTSPS